MGFYHRINLKLNLICIIFIIYLIKPIGKKLKNQNIEKNISKKIKNPKIKWEIKDSI